MEIGTVLLYISLIIGVGSVGFTIYYLFSKEGYYLRISKWLSIASCMMVSVTLLLLAYYFLVSDLHIEYVHSYTRTDYTLFYKWGGILAGAKGSLLFWVWLIALSLILEEFIQDRKERRHRTTNGGDDSRTDERALFVWVRLIVIIIIMAFLYLLINIDMFRPTEALALRNYPDGYGLHANLHTPLMIAHPPAVFAGYAFTTIPMAAGLAYLITGKGKWTNISLQWGRWAWFFYCLGIGIGGLWAYIVLGWGGYWAWDPIEIVNLIPLLPLTAFVHGQLYDHNRKMFRNVSILLIVVTLILSLLATFVTRSGLWVSVHDFAEVEVKEAGLRLITIMETNGSAHFFVTFMFAMLIITAILFTWHLMRPYIGETNPERRKVLPLTPTLYIGLMLILLVYVLIAPISFVYTAILVATLIGLGNGYFGGIIIFAVLMAIPVAWMFYVSEEEIEEAGSGDKKNAFSSLINDKNLMMITIFLLSIGAAITTFMLMMGINGIQREVFDSRAPLIALPLIIVLAACMVWRSLGRKNTLTMVVVMVAAGIIGYLLFPEPAIVGIALPILFIALFTAIYKVLIVTDGGKKVTWKLRLGGALLVSSGILGMIMWGAPPSRVALFSMYFVPTFEIAVFGFIFSSLAVVGGFFAAKRASFKLAVFGGICGLLVLGYFVGTVLSAIALVLIIASYREFSIDAKERISGRISRKLKRDFRLVWSHIIHLGLIVFIIGYVLSTYLVVETADDEAMQNRFHNMSRQDTLEFDGYEFKLVGSEGTTAENRVGYEIVEVLIEIYKDGELLSVAKPHMKWAEHMNHYHQFVYVENVVLKDIYFIVRGFYTPSQGWIYSMGGEGQQGVRFLSDDITAVALELKSLPGMSAVWGGFWIMSIGIVFIIIVGYLGGGYKDKHKIAKEKEEIDTGKSDGYYYEMLEKELTEMNQTMTGGKG
ncbi:MAG: cytochrome c biogenesis protein CcsA [Thermoplasmata archaeon]